MFCGSASSQDECDTIPLCPINLAGEMALCNRGMGHVHLLFAAPGASVSTWHSFYRQYLATYDGFVIEMSSECSDTCEKHHFVLAMVYAVI